MTEPSTAPPARMPYGSEPSSIPFVPHASRWNRSAVCTEPSSGISSDEKSKEKMSSDADASKLSLIAPATVPAASSDECSEEDAHATVAERLTDAIFGIAKKVEACGGGSALSGTARGSDEV